MRDISKLLYVISRAVRRVKFEIVLKYHEWYLCQISRTHHAIICLYYYTTTRERIVIFTCRYFKLSWNATALSQSNCRNFLWSGIIAVIARRRSCLFWGSANAAFLFVSIHASLLMHVMGEASLTQKAALPVWVSINEPNLVWKRISYGRSVRRVLITVVKI